MAYSMENKTPFKYPSTRYLNIIKQSYKDCDLDTKFLVEALRLKCCQNFKSLRLDFLM